QFCLANQIDPGNYSKLERGRLQPPKDISPILRGLGLTPSDDEWTELTDLAAVCSGKVPDDLLSDEKIVSSLPALFRTIRGTQLEEGKLDELIDLLRREG